ncbi:AAA family ATPase [uncultured Treponema sp.]|uniref:AAA family ATPase n=1 Tax=uncultured Treponema sp. TaxID=162155 RepID=UPI0026010E82|nr:AAA family ATPase [uncultured Treponema sp.]
MDQNKNMLSIAKKAVALLDNNDLSDETKYEQLATLLVQFAFTCTNISNSEETYTIEESDEAPTEEDYTEDQDFDESDEPNDYLQEAIREANEVMQEEERTENQDSAEHDSLFSIDEFNRIYSSLDTTKENDKNISSIKESLSGVPYFKEYTEEHIQKMKDLFEKYPNFKEYEEIFIPSKEVLSLKTDKKILMSNILIIGEPSCGKSSFVNKLCEIYGYYHRTTLGSGSVNFTLTGGDKGYDKSNCGDILRSLFKKDGHPIANPLVILDEIDKADYGYGGDRDLSGAFSVLLEKNNAKHFADNFFKVEVDASHINYIAIANDISKIPAHILSRFPIKLNIRNYTKEEIKSVVIENQYKDWITDNSINTKLVPEHIPEKTKELIFELSHGRPREVPSVLSQIAAKSICQKNECVIASFSLDENNTRELRKLFESESFGNNRKIGFQN